MTILFECDWLPNIGLSRFQTIQNINIPECFEYNTTLDVDAYSFRSCFRDTLSYQYWIKIKRIDSHHLILSKLHYEERRDYPNPEVLEQVMACDILCLRIIPHLKLITIIDGYHSDNLLTCPLNRIRFAQLKTSALLSYLFMNGCQDWTLCGVKYFRRKYKRLMQYILDNTCLDIAHVICEKAMGPVKVNKLLIDNSVILDYVQPLL